jgi:DNA polymerase-1
MLVTSSESLSSFLEKLRVSQRVTVDTETSGLEPWNGSQLVGLGFGFDDDSTYYLPFRHVNGPNLSLTELPSIFATLNRVPVISNHNVIFDLAILFQDGFRLNEGQSLEDTVSAGRLCEPDRFAHLDLTALAGKYLGSEAAAYDSIFIAALKAQKLNKAKIAQASVELVGAYCEADCDRTTRLRRALLKRIADTQQERVWEQECAVTGVLWRMEWMGLGFDLEYARNILPQLQLKVELLKKEIFALIGYEFNPGSPPQLAGVMEKLGIAPVKKSPRTQAVSWDKEALETVSSRHELPAKILEMRAVAKVANTDIKPRLDRGSPVLHEGFKSSGAVTGRMSSSLHTLPKEGIDVDGELVKARSLIKPRPGFRIWMGDYSQMEMLVFADYVGNSRLMEQAEKGEFDYHDYTTAELWGITSDHEDWKVRRRDAKDFNFGMIFGLGIKRQALILGLTIPEAKAYRTRYFSRIPGSEQFIEQAKRVAEVRGYVRNRFGRRYWIDPERIYTVVNYLVQGTSADLLKNRMVAIQRYIEEHNLLSRLLMQVHDELVFEIHTSEEAFFPKVIKDFMEERLLKIRLMVAMSVGNPGWGDKISMVWCGDRFHSGDEHKVQCLNIPVLAVA